MSTGSEQTNGARRDDRRHEFRAGAVFYGGVSLAIYENGVARAFHDAATGAGLFGPLLDLIDTRFIVDVISGSSAGGINGLLLAASLERGYDFRKTANLWRNHGGIESLLRPTDAEEPESLLQGETYYLDRLREAFDKICTHDKPKANVEQPHEIDVFVTGTDLAGSTRHFEDAFGNEVPTRTHRLVFHLQHRQGRKSLGYVRELRPGEGGRDGATEDTVASTKPERHLQADILASVARITSSFPGAFPPFTVQELRRVAPGRPEAVRYALQRLCGTDLSADPELIDGGVLDNRPFGPLLDAVFHRMPFPGTQGVTRRLFYVDPDPEVFKPEARDKFTPLAVAVNSVVALPSYDSITSDVDNVVTHNARMAHLKAARQRLAKAGVQPDADTPLYRYALERELMGLLSGSEQPSPQDPDGVEQDQLQRYAGSVEKLRSLSVGYHLRRAVSLFYGYAAESGDPALTTERDPEQAYAVGRVVKALKLLRDVWASELRRARRAYERDKSKAKWPSAAWRMHLLKRYLSGRWVWDQSPLSVLSAQHLESSTLSELALKARVMLRAEVSAEPAGFARLTESVAPERGAPSLLELLETHLEALLGGRRQLDEFAGKDSSLYPLELASGTHELDEIKIIRISPNDPTLPLDENDNPIPGRAKLTGDELAHFSAFLRRDFRTNDVAWGHVDGIERVARGLLDARDERGVRTAMQRAKARLQSSAQAFATDALLARLEGIAPRDAAGLMALRQTLMALEAAAGSCRAEGEALTDATWTAFIDAFITAAQTAAASEYVGVIHKDAVDQDREFNWPEAPALAPSSGSALQQLVALRRGDAPVLKALPPSIVVEYSSQAAILLWGMIEKSLSKPGLLAGARPYVLGALRVIYAVAALIRTERRVAALLLFGVFVGSLVLTTSFWFGATAKVVVLGLLGVVFCALCSQLLLKQRMRVGLRVASVTLLLVAVGWFVVTSKLTIVLPWSDDRYSLQLLQIGESSTALPAVSAPQPTASK
jgi:predicted acylesterase/phospholipase RssA